MDPDRPWAILCIQYHYNASTDPPVELIHGPTLCTCTSKDQSPKSNVHLKSFSNVILHINIGRDGLLTGYKQTITDEASVFAFAKYGELTLSQIKQRLRFG